MPENPQLPMPSVVLVSLEDEAKRSLLRLREGASATGRDDEEIAAETEIDKAQLSRIWAGTAHPPERLRVWVERYDRKRIYISHSCAVAAGEYRPKPPPSPAEELAAYRRVLGEMGLDEVVRSRALPAAHRPTSLRTALGEEP